MLSNIIEEHRSLRRRLESLHCAVMNGVAQYSRIRCQRRGHPFQQVETLIQLAGAGPKLFTADYLDEQESSTDWKHAGSNLTARAIARNEHLAA